MLFNKTEYEMVELLPPFKYNAAPNLAWLFLKTESVTLTLPFNEVYIAPPWPPLNFPGLALLLINIDSFIIHSPPETNNAPPWPVFALLLSNVELIILTIPIVASDDLVA